MPKQLNLYRNFSSQDQIDAQYRVAHSQEDLMRSRLRAQALSTEARANLKNSIGVAYGPTVEETLDIFSADKKDAPVFVFFHGGYWRALSSGDYSFVAVGPNAVGALTVSVNYALAPRVSLDEIVRQAKAAVAWVVKNIEKYGGDPSRIVLGGHSAGAQLAAMCMMTNWEADYGLDPSCMKGALLLSGVYDLTPLKFSFLQPQLQLDEGTVCRNSPALLPGRIMSPVFFSVGELETQEFHRQTQDYERILNETSHQTSRELVVNADHFSVVEQLCNPDSPMCRWIEKTLTKPLNRVVDS